MDNPSEMIVSSTESIWTDMLLILLMFLFVGRNDFEEKEKRSVLYYTKYKNTESLKVYLQNCQHC